MQQLRTLADRHNVLLMEDCAQVYGGGGGGGGSGDSRSTGDDTDSSTVSLGASVMAASLFTMLVSIPLV